MSDLKVEEVASALPVPELWGSFKVLEVKGSRLELFGWVLGKDSEVGRVEVLAGGSVIASTAPDVSREDIAKLHPERGSAATCGFRVVIEAKGKGHSELELRAMLADGSAVRMGAVRVLAPTRRWDVFRRR
ncbi:MAG TPA: hypothetical protein VFJ61_02110 [Solirubrobacterales bacterium]|nr:hypothetical protein [Solirubrobacterales bacterium]